MTLRSGIMLIPKTELAVSDRTGSSLRKYIYLNILKNDTSEVIALQELTTFIGIFGLGTIVICAYFH